MRVVLATGSMDLNQQVADYPFGDFPCEIVGECNVLAVLPDVVKELGADTVAVSSSVSDLRRVVAAVARLRYVGVRVIFLTGTATENKGLVMELAGLGVYNIPLQHLHQSREC